MPYAFSKTGVLLGVLVMLVVAGSNCLTSLLLLKAAGKTGSDSYEGIALAIGGPKWKVREHQQYTTRADFGWDVSALMAGTHQPDLVSM